MLRKVGVNPSADISFDIQPCENPFMREIVVGNELKFVPDTHPISRELSADSFSIEALDDAGLNKPSNRPLLRSTFEERLSTLEKKLEQRASFVMEKRLYDSSPDSMKQMIDNVNQPSNPILENE